MSKSDLPFGSEFSPSQVALPHLLELAQLHAGDWRSFEAAVRATYFETHQTSDRNKQKLANNTRLGMIAYGLLDRETHLTELGHHLYQIRQDEARLYTALARHILLNLNGMAFISCIQDMVVAGEEVNLTTLRQALAVRGIHYPSGGKHPSMMRLWLAKAGVFIGARWRIDSNRLQTILGASEELYNNLRQLTLEQQTFLRALANTGLQEPQSASQIVRLAEAVYGVKFPEKSLPKLVLDDLERAGYITATKTTSGRGAKPFLVAPTPKLAVELVEPFFKQLTRQGDSKLLSLLRKPLDEVLHDLRSPDRHVAGLALEALGFKLMRLLDMDYVATRLRGEATGGAEVDLIFESARLVHSRWQVQCKNTARVSLDDIAKEVGLTHFLKSTVIVIVTTGGVTTEARRYANKVMSDSNLAIVIVEGGDLANIISNPATIISVFQREARHAMQLKALAL